MIGFSIHFYQNIKILNRKIYIVTSLISSTTLSAGDSVTIILNYDCHAVIEQLNMPTKTFLGKARPNDNDEHELIN